MSRFNVGDKVRIVDFLVDGQKSYINTVDTVDKVYKIERSRYPWAWFEYIYSLKGNCYIWYESLLEKYYKPIQISETEIEELLTGD